MDLKKLIEDTMRDMVELKPKFNILLVSDENSRLSELRGFSAIKQFKHFYHSIATISVTTMESERFREVKPDLSKYNIVWVDNVINRGFNTDITAMVGAYVDTLVPGWRETAEGMAESEKAEFIAQVNEYRALKIRVLYFLDEFVWDAPAGRQKNVIEGITVQEAMGVSDAVVVPNVEMASALTELELVDGEKDVLVIPTFVSDSFYPVHKMATRSKTGITSIRKPKILVKGVTLPKNVQNLIIHGTDEYEFVISTVGELDDRLMKLLQTPKSKEEQTVPLVGNIKHWSNPLVNSNNILDTMAIERDMNFDFVILCEPEDIENDIYNITITDTDALLAVASGAVAIAEIDDAGFGKGVHLCNETGITFGRSTSVADLRKIIEKWRPTEQWDEAYKIQRKLLEDRLVSSQPVMAGFFHAMLGKKVSDLRHKKYGEGKE